MRPLPLDAVGLVLCAAILAATATGIVLGRARPLVDDALTAAGADAPTGLICRASWYEAGELTASGEPFDPNGLTAASRTLPLGSRIVVTELIHGRSVIVRVNDRGPYVDGRCVDLTPTAFVLLAPLDQGVIPVRVAVLELV